MTLPSMLAKVSTLNHKLADPPLSKNAFLEWNISFFHKFGFLGDPWVYFLPVPDGTLYSSLLFANKTPVHEDHREKECRLEVTISII